MLARSLPSKCTSRNCICFFHCSHHPNEIPPKYVYKLFQGHALPCAPVPTGLFYFSHSRLPLTRHRRFLWRACRPRNIPSFWKEKKRCLRGRGGERAFPTTESPKVFRMSLGTVTVTRCRSLGRHLMGADTESCIRMKATWHEKFG